MIGRGSVYGRLVTVVQIFTKPIAFAFTDDEDILAKAFRTEGLLSVRSVNVLLTGVMKNRCAGTCAQHRWCRYRRWWQGIAPSRDSPCNAASNFGEFEGSCRSGKVLIVSSGLKPCFEWKIEC